MYQVAFGNNGKRGKKLPRFLEEKIGGFTVTTIHFCIHELAPGGAFDLTTVLECNASVSVNDNLGILK